MDKLIEQFRESLPPAFPLKNIGPLTGGTWHSRTIANLKAAKKIPHTCFCKKGRMTLVIRDPFLEHQQSEFKDVKGGE